MLLIGRGSDLDTVSRSHWARGLVILMLNLMALLPMAVAYGAQKTADKRKDVVEHSARRIQRIGEVMPVRLVLVPTLQKDAAHYQQAAFSLSHGQIFRLMEKAAAKLR